MKSIITTLVLLPLICFGQKQGNIWYFGDRAGLDFNSGSPQAILDGSLGFSLGYTHNEGSSCISDSTGAILFYSNGMKVWNRNHEVMLNGDGLLGNFSSCQSSIIVPDPSSPDSLYYIFTMSSLMGVAVSANPSDGFRYSKIDRSLDGSLGGIIPGEKNIKIADTTAEKIAVTKHANGVDYWVLTHKFYSNQFWAFLLDSTGISDTVITAIGAWHGGHVYGVQGQLKFSPNGERVAIGASNGLDILEVFDFDKSTGLLSNAMPLHKPNDDQASIYGVEFSPDNTKLYASGTSSLGPVYPFLAQYDLSAGDGSVAAINNSMIEVYHNEGPGIVGGRGLQLAPDNKIYWVSLSLDNAKGTLATVHNPNIAGFGCNYQDQAIHLGGRKGSYSLPSFVAGLNYSPQPTDCENADSTVDPSDDPQRNFLIYPNPFTDQAILKIDHCVDNAILTLYNSSGQLVQHTQNISGSEIPLYRNELATGFYFFMLSSQENEIVSTGKISIVN